MVGHREVLHLCSHKGVVFVHVLLQFKSKVVYAQKLNLNCILKLHFYNRSNYMLTCVIFPAGSSNISLTLSSGIAGYVVFVEDSFTSSSELSHSMSEYCIGC